MTLTTGGQHLVWFFGFALFAFPIDSALGFLIYHALDFTAILLFIGLVLALHRRFHDLSLISVQRFGFDLMPLALLMAIVVTGLALTADSTWLRGAYYWYISLTHEAVVVLWLISLPFGKFFHLLLLVENHGECQEEGRAGAFLRLESEASPLPLNQRSTSDRSCVSLLDAIVHSCESLVTSSLPVVRFL